MRKTLMLSLLALATQTSAFDPSKYVESMGNMAYDLIKYLVIIAVPILLIYAFFRSTLSVFERKR